MRGVESCTTVLTWFKCLGVHVLCLALIIAAWVLLASQETTGAEPESQRQPHSPIATSYCLCLQQLFHMRVTSLGF